MDVGRSYTYLLGTGSIRPHPIGTLIDDRVVFLPIPNLAKDCIFISKNCTRGQVPDRTTMEGRSYYVSNSNYFPMILFILRQALKLLVWWIDIKV